MRVPDKKQIRSMVLEKANHMRADIVAGAVFPDYELPDWDITTPELKAAWERGQRDRFYPYGGKTYGQVFREQE
jgi:hypothetical protein